jgi:hypothetical protein
MTGLLVVPTLAGAPPQNQSLEGFWAASCESRVNTAATLWCSASVGAFAGAGRPAEAAAVTAFVLAGNTLLRPLVN